MVVSGEELLGGSDVELLDVSGVELLDVSGVDVLDVSGVDVLDVSGAELLGGSDVLCGSAIELVVSPQEDETLDLSIQPSLSIHMQPGSKLQSPVLFHAVWQHSVKVTIVQ